MTAANEILTVEQTRAADRAAEAHGVASLTLLQNAGAAVANAVAQRFRPQPVLVLCGPGLNGGDGYVAARILAEQGFPVRIMAPSEPAGGDAAIARAAWPGPVEPLRVDLGEAGLVIDALFGAGLSRPLDPLAVSVLEACEARGLPIIAVDLPSGLPGDAARPLGYAPHCRMTVTFHRKKPAHVLFPSRSLCGEVIVADIGVPEAASPPSRLWENAPALWLERFPWPAEDAHKHARGRLAVVSGAVSSTGAARMAARAGLRAGAGLVKLFCPFDAVSLNAGRLEAVMLQGFDGDQELGEAAAAFDAVIIGPAAGVTDATVANLFALAKTGAALVVDADALSVFRDEPSELFAVLDRDDVLTPHAGEFERVFPGLLGSTPNRIAAVRAAAAKAEAVVLLKGPDTVVAAPDGRAVVNTTTSRWLATAGSGDVLAGIIGALLVQGMNSFDAAATGVWLHGAAGALAGPGLIAEDLTELLPQVLRELYEQAGQP